MCTLKLENLFFSIVTGAVTSDSLSINLYIFIPYDCPWSVTYSDIYNL